MRLLAIAVLFAGCDCSDTPQRAYSTQPPAPATPAAMPSALEDALPKTDDGLPIVVQTGAGLPSGLSLALAYDATLADPIALWGQCLSRVTACYRTNEGPITGCVDLIEVCADDAGGEGCCPRACLDRFHELRDGGTGEDDAVNGSFLEGSCIPGFVEVEP